MYTIIYHSLNLPVSASDREIRQAVAAKLNADCPPQRRERIKRAVLREHHAAQRLYQVVQRGL